MENDSTSIHNLNPFAASIPENPLSEELRKELIAYEDSLKVFRDWYSTMQTAILKGRREGEEIGLEKGRKEGEEKGRKETQLGIARQMKADGMDAQTIANYTHLSLKEIESL